MSSNDPPAAGFKPAAFYREAGSGEAVICMHSNASSSSQWRALMERLAPRWRVLAPDLLGAGKGPPWPTDRAVTLEYEVALIEPLLAAAGNPLRLVGHSYGAAVTLMAALAHRTKVRSIVLYEPTLFAVIEQQAPGHPDADGIRAAVVSAGAALDAGDVHGAAQCFIDYWMGAGAWAAMPQARRDGIAPSVANVRGWWHALAMEPTPLARFGALDMPVLYLIGSQTTAAAKAVARRLTSVLPDVTLVELAGLGHMGPITHPDFVNEAIESFFARH